MTRPTMPNEYPAGSFDDVASMVPSALLEDLKSAGVAFDTSTVARADHGRDWWPLSIPDVARGRVPRWPGVVVRPTSSDEVGRVLQCASKYGTAVTAQGGRSSVVGGAVAPEGAVALDLTGLNRILDIDTVSGLVRVEAGVFGPELERAVADEGWTVGHFPQSFGLATVGGWIACRGAGQYSNRYGKIEDIVRGLSVVLASGDPFDQRGISKLGAGDVDRHREFLAAALGVRPSRELPTCLVQHEVVNRCGESEPIGDRNERGGKHQSVLGVAPANERQIGRASCR